MNSGLTYFFAWPFIRQKRRQNKAATKQYLRELEKERDHMKATWKAELEEQRRISQAQDGACSIM